MREVFLIFFLPRLNGQGCKKTQNEAFILFCPIKWEREGEKWAWGRCPGNKQ